MSQNQSIKVYYNSACPVCKAGIEHQKLKMQGCSVVWNDVHSDDNLAREIDSELEFVRERLHVVDESGNLQIGFDAFLAIWRNSPNEGAKATLLGQPIVRHLCRISYNLFAALLYQWNKYLKHW
jgi:predicted DCC family thiol-disulfide oxidoreductase YuxK